LCVYIGFDWKIVGPDVGNVDYVAWQCDQDAYASSGQKCSAQSILFIHENWKNSGLLQKIQENAETRCLDNLTVGPTLTVNNNEFKDHVKNLLSISGSRLLFGGDEIEGHSIPSIYGSMKPTAIFVPLEQLLKEEYFDICTTEIFAPFQVVTEYNDSTLEDILKACEGMSHHLTAAVVSNNVLFQNKILSRTVNGTTYTGRRARTTGAPQNHWFGPCGDVRGCGIGTPEAIKFVWSLHRYVINIWKIRNSSLISSCFLREIITDSSVPDEWCQPAAS